MTKLDIKVTNDTAYGRIYNTLKYLQTNLKSTNELTSEDLSYYMLRHMTPMMVYVHDRATKSDTGFMDIMDSLGVVILHNKDTTQTTLTFGDLTDPDYKDERKYVVKIPIGYDMSYKVMVAA